MNIFKMRNRLTSLTTAALLAGIGLVGTATGAGAMEGKESEAIAGPVTAVQAPVVNAIDGTYTITTDWGCDGSITGSFSQTFRGDGTWTSSSYSGRWFQVGSTVVWTFSSVANLVYSGTISGTWMTGVQGYTAAGGSNGCFTAGTSVAAAVEGDTTGFSPALGG